MLRTAAPLLLLFATGVAFGISQDTPTGAVLKQNVVVDALAVPIARPSHADNPTINTFEYVRRGDTVSGFFDRVGIPSLSQDLPRLIQTLRESPYFILVPGQSMHVTWTDDGQINRLAYSVGDAKRIIVSKSPDGRYTSVREPIAFESRSETKSVVIASSLFEAGDRANLPDSVLMQLVKLYGTSVDFRTDLRRGDVITVTYDLKFDPGTGDSVPEAIVAAELELSGVKHRVFRQKFEGSFAYFNDQGNAIEAGYLRSPVEFSRISSGFSSARLHPVLGYSRKHEGTDFAASMGTKVLAASTGTVAFKGYKAGYGNIIVLKHPGKVETVYAHLRGFSKQLRVGASVKQREILGYVGMTGTTTGPHLHYEVHLAGKAVDPMHTALPRAASLKYAGYKTFVAQASHRMALYRDVPGTVAFE